MIGACKEEKSEVILGQKRRQKAKGNLSGDYCDISGGVGNLVRQLCKFNTLSWSL